MFIIPEHSGILRSAVQVLLVLKSLVSVFDYRAAVADPVRLHPKGTSSRCLQQRSGRAEMSWDANPYHLNVPDHRLRGCSRRGIMPAKTNLPLMGYFLLGTYHFL